MKQCQPGQNHGPAREGLRSGHLSQNGIAQQKGKERGQKHIGGHSAGAFRQGQRFGPKQIGQGAGEKPQKDDRATVRPGREAESAHGLGRERAERQRGADEAPGGQRQRAAAPGIAPLQQIVAADADGCSQSPENPVIEGKRSVPERKDQDPGKGQSQSEPARGTQPFPQQPGRHDRRDQGRGGDQNAARGGLSRVEQPEIQGKAQNAGKQEYGPVPRGRLCAPRGQAEQGKGGHGAPQKAESRGRERSQCHLGEDIRRGPEHDGAERVTMAAITGGHGISF